MEAPQQQILPASKPHQWLTLIGATFVVFEIVFIGLYSDNFWFSWNLMWFGIPAIVSALVAAHFALLAVQSNFACRWLSFLFKGKPPLAYTKWIAFDADGFTYGVRHVRFAAIDSAELSWFGNMIFRSRAVCGSEQKDADIVFKLPFACAEQDVQKNFVDALQSAKPDIRFNARLTKRLNSPIVRGQNLVQAIGALMMFVLLLDLGYSSFYYLEMLKHYYLAETFALDGKSADATRELTLGDDIRSHPLMISYITTRFLNVGNCAAGVSNARADALWELGRKSEAITEAKKAITATPEMFREYLHYARLLQGSGKTAEAVQQVQIAIDKHKDSLLPHLYMLALAKENNPSLVAPSYRQAIEKLNERNFQGEPRWPPGGDEFVHDLYYSKDVYFVFNRLLGVDLKPQRNQ